MKDVFEILCREPFFSLYTVNEMQYNDSLAEIMKTCLSDDLKKIFFIIGDSNKKSYIEIIDIITPITKEFIYVRTGQEDGTSEDEIVEFIRRKGFTLTVCSYVEEGLKLSLQKASVPGNMTPVCALCSQYTANVIRNAFPLICKRQQRKLATARRRSLSQEERDQKSRLICNMLIEFLKKNSECKGKTLFSYRGTWEEVNVDFFNNWAESQGYRVAYPLSLPHGIMKAAVPNDKKSWHRAVYDILEPVIDQSEILDTTDIDLIIVPCVAFDTNGSRCGHGAGYYDRYMTDIDPDALIMVAFETQRVETLMTEKTDLPIRTIITEARIYEV